MSDDNLLGDEVQTGDDANSDSAVDQQIGGTTQGADADGNSDSASNDTDEGSQTPPEEYADFNLPEGMELNTELLDKASPVFKEIGLTQEQAQKLVNLEAERNQASYQAQVDAFNQLKEEWAEQSKNDKEYGGDKFDESISLAKNAVDKFGSPGLKQLLEEHGVGNHPEVIRFMVNVGKLTAEDVPGGSTTPVAKEQDRVNQLYPNDRNNG